MDALVFDVEKEQNQNRQQLLGEDEPSFSSGAPETASHMRNLGTSTHNLVMQQAELLSSLNLADFPGKETDQEWQYIDPPDSGYSWLVLFCCIILHLASGTLSATAGLFLVEFNDAFKGNESGYSWICTLQQTMGFLAGPLIGKLADKIGARTTIIMGCIGVAISLVFASLTSNFVVLLLTYGILAGEILTVFVNENKN
ncbi:SLC16A4 [Bugula neritina]|uniref:SLC16A4 n=1 Tax=Bugula neritina TaxID=10212 RepID=A0A7J7KT00_BUGNE|nr:SLC16A4 [Bugula neritina]